jgi:hypothetical protein
MGFVRRSRFLLACLVATAGTVLYSTSSLAAEKVVLKYGIFRQSVPVADLTEFAETGDHSLLKGYRISESDAQQVRTALTQPVTIDARWLDRGLNNPLGSLLLDEVGQTIQAPAKGTSREALRSALVLSAADDGQLSLLEVIQKYPTREVYVDAKRLANTYNQIAQFEGQIRQVLGVIDWLK